MNFSSSLGVLLWKPRPNIDTLLCSIGLECVKKYSVVLGTRQFSIFSIYFSLLVS